ncbi:unnamed protein product [Hydatigera taeniaeformis]|uniref:Uncharacterized protein n=1 Tax=Hydatigena taeniaeformis TaxID=6205 RepID=A0A0R3X2B4_HYDTA|nr:unnamed protein product [Hydatigera taeniaeformis]
MRFRPLIQSKHWREHEIEATVTAISPEIPIRADFVVAFVHKTPKVVSTENQNRLHLWEIVYSNVSSAHLSAWGDGGKANLCLTYLYQTQGNRTTKILLYLFRLRYGLK